MKRLHLPVMLYKVGPGLSTKYGDKPDIAIRFRKQKMAGSMRTTSWTLQVITQTKQFDWCFVWRPDVTRYWWKEHRKQKKQNR